MNVGFTKWTGHGPCQDKCNNFWGGYNYAFALSNTKLATNGHRVENLSE